MRFGRRDSTHLEVKGALRAVGASVFDTADVGQGFPDLVVGYRGRTYLLEVKAPGGKLQESQKRFAATWRGAPFIVVHSRAEALEAIGLAAAPGSGGPRQGPIPH